MKLHINANLIDLKKYVAIGQRGVPSLTHEPIQQILPWDVQAILSPASIPGCLSGAVFSIHVQMTHLLPLRFGFQQ